MTAREKHNTAEYSQLLSIAKYEGNFILQCIIIVRWKIIFYSANLFIYFAQLTEY